MGGWNGSGIVRTNLFTFSKMKKNISLQLGKIMISVRAKFYFMADTGNCRWRIYLPLDMMKLMWKDESEVIELDGKIQLVVCV